MIIDSGLWFHRGKSQLKRTDINQVYALLTIKLQTLIVICTVSINIFDDACASIHCIFNACSGSRMKTCIYFYPLT